MNKITKAIVAVAAGSVLLMGGAGTLAVWNGSVDVSALAPISAGSLSLSAPTAGVWTDQTGSTVNLATYRVSPGDTLTYRTTVNLTATGDRLTGAIALSTASISAVTTGSADTKLAQLLTKSASYTVDGATGSTFTAKSGTQPIAVTVSIRWPSGTAIDDNAAMNGKVSLANFALTVNQS